jgi:hypothetical protein
MQALSQLSYTPVCLDDDASCRTGTETVFINSAAVSPATPIKSLAEWTGLEPATPGVTGRYSNQLNYHSTWLTTALTLLPAKCRQNLASPRGFEPL